MTLADIKNRLHYHANLPSESDPDGSLCYLLYKSKRDRRQADFGIAFQDVLVCLAELNKVWNGPIPSKTANEMKDANLDRWIIYSISSILSDAAGYALLCALDKESTESEVRVAVELTFALGCAWESVLAGDIDDLRETVRLELEAKTPDTASRILKLLSDIKTPNN